MTKQRVVREGIVAVHQHCFNQPYIELQLPDDVKLVTQIEFTASCRDQGWYDNETDPSYATINASVKRPAGRNDLQTLRIFTNRRGALDFEEHRCTLDQPEWCHALQAKDIIQLIPITTYTGWVGFLRRASIEIEYESIKTETPASTQVKTHDQFYPLALSQDEREIRIIKLQPGYTHDRIQCSLERTSLGRGVDFDALSYCWGDISDTIEIEIDATTIGGPCGPFHISRSVSAFLKRIRHHEQHKTLWIDQICINQNDNEERAQQVELMAQLYSKAAVVHVWLGEGNSGAYESLRIVRDIYNFDNRVCPGAAKCRCEGTTHMVSLEHVKSSSSHDALYEIFAHHRVHFNSEITAMAGGFHNEQVAVLLSTVFANPWFRRVWVLQEVLRTLHAQVHCGAEIVPWSEVVEVGARLASEDHQRLEAHVLAPASMPKIWNQLRSQATSVIAHGSDITPYRKLPVLDVILNGLELKATDPRDKLFSLYSFSRDIDLSLDSCADIRPSYTKPPERVFADFTRWWIREHNSLSILSAIHALPGRSWMRNDNVICEASVQPTWAIGSDGRTQSAQNTLDAQACYDACKNTTPNRDLLEHVHNVNPEELHLQGYKVAQIQEITYLSEDVSRIHDMRESEKALLGAFYRTFGSWAKNNLWKGQDIKDIPDFQWYQDNGDIDHFRAHWGYKGLRTGLLAAIDPISLPTGDYTRQYTWRISKCLDPSLMLATNGLYGLCPWTARVGDIITVLDGGRVPYLLRLVRTGEETETFELVGECYVVGAMKGEYFEEQTEKGRPRDVFVLR